MVEKQMLEKANAEILEVALNHFKQRYADGLSKKDLLDMPFNTHWHYLFCKWSKSYDQMTDPMDTEQITQLLKDSLLPSLREKMRGN